MHVGIAVVTAADGEFAADEFAIDGAVCGEVDVSHGAEYAVVVIFFDGDIFELHGH